MEFLYFDDEDEYACVEDFLLDHELPENGCLLDIHLHGGGDTTNLNAKIVIADSASWEVPVLNVGQESYAHGGFRGTIHDLLQKVIHDIDMMKPGYSLPMQKKFDLFISQVEMLLNGSGGGQNSDIHLVIRDPSGLSTTNLLHENEQQQQQQQQPNVQVSYFPRSLNEEKDLGILDNDSLFISNYIKVLNPLTSVIEIAELISKSNNIVALTGAGISVESGITPFRSSTNNVVVKNTNDVKNDKRKGEILNKNDNVDNQNENGNEGVNNLGVNNLAAAQVDEKEVVVYDDEEPLLASSIWSSFDVSRMTISRFNNNENEEDSIYWWKMKHAILPEILKAKPNPAHKIFAHLSKQNKLSCVITQNIDSLHSTAGVPTSKVIELHGHMRGLICSDHITPYNPQPYKQGECQYKLSYEEANELEYYKNMPLPKCPKCNSPLRTETVFFEQVMPYGLMEQASMHVANADLLIIIGTTMVVKPASELPLEALRRKTPVIIINPYDKTQYDDYATGLVREPAGEFMAKVLELL
jgi:NAD-dependent deacetylase